MTQLDNPPSDSANMPSISSEVAMQAALVLHDLRYAAKQAAKKVLGRYREPVIHSRVPVRAIKRMMRENGLATFEGANPSWFYTAYERGDADPLTNYTLGHIKDAVPKDARILVTGCGTGIMLFHLLDAGFETVHGFDLLDECVSIANRIADLGGYKTKIWKSDGLKPEIEQQYDIILALHWVFSAWMGNYGNAAVAHKDAKSMQTREFLLRDMLSGYVTHLRPGGKIIIELTDSVADYRVPTETPGIPGMTMDDIYPVRFSPSHVERIAGSLGMDVADYKMSSYGRQPRTVYRLTLR